MAFWLYDEFEKEYHELESSACSCNPDIRFLEPSGELLIIHHKLAEEADWTEGEIRDAIAEIQLFIAHNPE